MLFGRTLLQWGWGQECQEQKGSQGLVFMAGKQQCSSRLQHLCCGAAGPRAALFGSGMAGKEELWHWAGTRLLHSLPNEALAWVSSRRSPPVFRPTQEINGSVFIWGGLVLHWTRAEDSGADVPGGHRFPLEPLQRSDLSRTGMGPEPHHRAKALDGAQLASSPGLPLPQAQMWHCVKVTARSQHRDLLERF